MFSSQRLSTAVSLSVLVFAFGCGSSGATAGSAGADAAFEVTTSQLFITATNLAGRPLVNIKVVVIPVGRATQFSTSYSRLETGERREFSLGQFRGSDGTPLNLRIHKPRSVKVSGTDIDGKVHEAEVPWQ